MKIEINNDQFSVLAEDEIVKAKKIVIAAGAFCSRIGKMLGIDIPVIPVRGQMWSTKQI